MYEVRENTRETTAKLRSCGYQVVEMWGCEWLKEKESNPECRDYVKKLQFTERLNPRDAFFGARTNATKLYHKTSDTEKIKYVDFTSLYPYINKNSRYPTGHPEIIMNARTTDIKDYFGVIKCKVRAPRGLYHPVLPVRVHQKLLFPLCKACAEIQLEKNYRERCAHCPHDDTEREFIGTWCSPELEVALDKGYDIVEIYEVYHFKDSKEGLFDQYVNKWLKIKVEASPWPEWCTTEAKKRQFIRDFHQKEGIELEYDKIGENKGLRSLAKLMLNSMWGKFGQRPNKTQVWKCTDPQEFHDFLESDMYDIHKIQLHNDSEDTVEVFYTLKEEVMELNGKINVFIACFTTCWARLRLYDTLDQLDDRAFYYDTDSVIFLEDAADPDQFRPQLGDYLGDFTNELKPPTDYIIEFASAGPKNYGYLTHMGKTECKVKGFSLNVEGSKYLNFELLRDNVKMEIRNQNIILGLDR